MIVEDDLTFSRMLSVFLEKKGFKVELCSTSAKALQSLRAQKFDLVITDYRLPDDTGIGILHWVKSNMPEVKVILMTRYTDIRVAISSMKMGALDYLVKPLNPDELLHAVNDAFDTPATSVRTEKKTPAPSASDKFITGESEMAQMIQEQISLVAPTTMSVIIEGESGTGKEYTAQQIHQQSERSAKPFVAVDCGALSKELAPSEMFGHIKGAFTGAVSNKTGQFEAANGGTIFLDEIGNLTYDVQVQLLRAIQERKIRKVGDVTDVEVDVRIIVATNEDLKQQVLRGNFREDLYHRLNEFRIQVPPLRNRGSDIELFAHHFLKKANEQLEKDVQGFSAEVMSIFKRYNWPGNLRELKNIVKRAVLLTRGDIIETDAIPFELLEMIGPVSNSFSPFDLKEQNQLREREMIIKILRETKFNKAKTARLLNIDRKTLYLKIEKYSIEA